MAKRFIMIGGVVGLLSIAFGAFGAHVLERVLDPEDLDTFHTGVDYQMAHAIALVLTGILARIEPVDGKWIRLAGYGFLTGIVLFSGSLYAVSLSGIGAFGMVAPFGGLCLMAGWLFVVLSVRHLMEKTK
jgi:uncharacterized membrane protein YgdD (TMEM256/DUF423 family)